jgi:hypothetical protein
LKDLEISDLQSARCCPQREVAVQAWIGVCACKEFVAVGAPAQVNGIGRRGLTRNNLDADWFARMQSGRARHRLFAGFGC